MGFLVVGLFPGDGILQAFPLCSLMTGTLFKVLDFRCSIVAGISPLLSYDRYLVQGLRL